MKQENPLPVGRGFKFSIKHLVRQHQKRFPRGEAFRVALKSRPMTDEECGQ